MRHARWIVFAFLLCLVPATGVPQEPTRLLRVGLLVNGAPGTPLSTAALESLRRAFGALGYEEGRHVAFVPRCAAGQLDRLPGLAKDLAGANVDLILALGGPASRAAKDATARIPVVFSIVTDPVALGLVASMDRPGANVTGVTNLDPGQSVAQMQLLKEVAPAVTKLAILSDVDIPGADANGHAPIDRDYLSAAQSAGFQARVVKLKGPAPDLEAAFAALRQQGVQAVVALEVPVVLVRLQRIAQLATADRLPTVFPGGSVDAGGLLAYGTTVADTWPRMPAIADRIFKGAVPGELPVQTVTRRELAVHLGTARQLGLAVPPQVLARADRTIE